MIAYVCDGANLAQCFTGSLQGDRLDLGAANGARLSANVQRPAGVGNLRAASGTFRSADGQSRTFSSDSTDPLGRAGLYRGIGAAGSIALAMGVIILPDGNLRGVLRAGQFLLPVTNPAFATNGPIATFPEFGPVTAQRLGTP